MSQVAKLEEALSKMDDIRSATEEWKIYTERVTNAFSEMSCEVDLAELDLPTSLKKEIETFLKKQEPDQRPPEEAHDGACDLFDQLETILDEARDAEEEEDEDDE